MRAFPALALFLALLPACEDPPPAPTPIFDPIPYLIAPSNNSRVDASGVQRTDAVWQDGRIFMAFDFLPFHSFNPGQDGGDLIEIRGTRVSIVETQDGGAGFQVWCEGWPLFETTANQGELLTRLSRAPSRAECPTTTSRVRTVWRREHPTLISEHFAGDDEDHMERFIFTYGVGRTAWERWEHIHRTRTPPEHMQLMITVMNGDGRCPLPANPPSPDYVRTDCRVWNR